VPVYYQYEIPNSSNFPYRPYYTIKDIFVSYNHIEGVHLGSIAGVYFEWCYKVDGSCVDPNRGEKFMGGGGRGKVYKLFNPLIPTTDVLWEDLNGINEKLGLPWPSSSVIKEVKIY
jgi:hypothetical protein